MSISALPSITSSVSPIVSLGQGIKAVSSIRTFIGSPVPENSSLARLSDRFWKTLEYMPDVWTVGDKAVFLAQHYAVAVPVILRTVVAGFASLNILLVPQIALNAVKSLASLVMTLPRQGLVGLFEGSIRITYLSGLTSALTAIGSSGIKDFAQKAGLPTAHLNQVISAIVPWVGYTLRLSAILQLMDISSGVTATSTLSQYRPRVWEWMAGPLPGINKHQTLVALETIRGHKRLFRKLVDSDTKLVATVRRIEGRVNSWIPFVPLIGQFQAARLVRKLEAKANNHVHNQLLGLSANTCAIGAMIVTANVVAAAAFSIFASLFYIAQTYHRQQGSR